MVVGLIEGDHFDDEQCLAVLSLSRLGRISLTLRAVPVVFPVPYLVRHGRVFVGVSVDQLARAMTRTVVALQADGWSDDEGKRWTAQAIGTMTLLSVNDEYPGPEQSDAWTATPWDERHLFRLHPQLLSGRWFDA